MKKKLLAGFLAFALVASGIVVAPEKAEAADTIVYETVADFAELKATKKAPAKAGYVFGGWYEDAKGETALTEETVATAETAYAKFVPDYVLSVKAQITTGTTKETDTTSLRVISSVDSTDYQKVGFKILVANDEEKQVKDGEAPTESVKVFTGLKASGNVLTADKIFGAASAFLSTFRMDNIGKSSFGTVVYVQPYWKTMDGTVVEGLARFLHVEDSYMNYVSVPVNLTTGEAVAAGALAMKYDSSVVKVVENGVEYGNVFEEMAHNDDKAGTIKFVGNGATVDVDAIADDLYANVRFEIIDESYEGAASGTFLTFTVENEDFANWDEETVEIDAADVKY